MAKDSKIRWGWLKAMYIYTIVGAGGFGAGIIIMPEVMKTMFAWPANEPIALGVLGSVFVAFGLLSILGLRSPLKFAPVLLLQLCYKSVWFIGVVLPLLVTGHFPGYAMPFVLIFASYIIGDLIAIPFHHLFAREPGEPGDGL
jgi:hypothetical protein